MPNLATWMRESDAKWFDRFFGPETGVRTWNARTGPVPLAQMDGLLLTGGPDVAAEFLRQEISDPSLILDAEPARDRWELNAVQDALARGLPILAICKGMQLLNVALGGTLRLDIPNHNDPEMEDRDLQLLRTAKDATTRFESVNSSHHQAVDRLGDGCEAEAWCATDDVIEQMRLKNHPYALAVQYHPERGESYGALFAQFTRQLKSDNSTNSV